MTPEEKAVNLYFKYCKELNSDYVKAKKCALIAVDEILNEFPWRPSEGTSYWEQVKKEIENYGK